MNRINLHQMTTSPVRCLREERGRLLLLGIEKVDVLRVIESASTQPNSHS